MKIDLKKAIESNLISDIQIRFNGLKINNCIYADDKNGIAIVLDLDEFKKLRKYDIPEIPHKILKGDVWILFGDRK